MMLSWSRCSSYLSCPKAYEYRYILEEAPSFRASALVFGSVLHQCLADRLRARWTGETEPGSTIVRQVLHEALSTETGSGADDSSATLAVELDAPSWSGADLPIRFGARETVDGLVDLGVSMVESWVASPDSGLDQPLLAVEERVLGRIDPELPEFIGYIDAVCRDDEDRIVLVDHKTTRSSWSPATVKQHAGQLILYSLLWRKQEDEAERSDEVSSEQLAFVTITKNKSPVVQRHPVESDQRLVDATIEQLKQVWKGIEAGAFPARPGWMCGSCPYNDRCPHAAVDND